MAGRSRKYSGSSMGSKIGISTSAAQSAICTTVLNSEVISFGGNILEPVHSLYCHAQDGSRCYSRISAVTSLMGGDE